MSAPRFTPGPWMLADPWSVQTSQDSHGVASTFAAENGEANARLIAAAPDLYAELAMLIEAVEGHSPPEGCATDDPYIESRLSFARAALAKAVTP